MLRLKSFFRSLRADHVLAAAGSLLLRRRKPL